MIWKKYAKKVRPEDGLTKGGGFVIVYKILAEFVKGSVNMKEIKIIPLAFAFAGCFLGAGFVSGQELWQFFGEFGVKGYIGLLLACVLLAAFGVIMMRLLQESGIEKAEEIMVPWDVPFLRMAAGLILNIFLLCVVVIMTAGGRHCGAAFWLCRLRSHRRYSYF